MPLVNGKEIRFKDLTDYDINWLVHEKEYEMRKDIQNFNWSEIVTYNLDLELLRKMDNDNYNSNITH